jgi:hypothetical protein
VFDVALFEPPLVVLVVVDVVTSGHFGQDAQNHCLHAKCQPPPNEEHKISAHSAVVEVVVLVVLVEVVVVV